MRNFQKVNEHFGTENDVKELVQEAHAKGMKVVFQFPLGKRTTSNRLDEMVDQRS